MERTFPDLEFHEQKVNKGRQSNELLCVWCAVANAKENAMVKVVSTCYAGGEISTQTKTVEKETDYSRVESCVVNVYPDAEYQTLLGFGGAVTEAAGYVYQSLNEEARKKVIAAYYGEGGNNYAFGRCSIDSSDFGLGNYSAKESEDAPFSLARDAKYVMPLLDDIYRERKIKLFFAPWSPPAYMKTNGEKNHGGKLKAECYSAWAAYMCEYLAAYRELGYDVYAVSTQNEPHATQRWDSCVYTMEEESDFVGGHLYPQMQEKGLGDVRRIVWDHNKERSYERLDGMSKRIADKNAVSGVGYHWYSGDHFGALKLIYERYPDKLSVFTEGCAERFVKDKAYAGKNAERYAREIIGCLNHGCNVFIDWNILLDENGGPNHESNFCEAPIMADGQGGIVFNPSYYAIGQFSKYLVSGAKRIATSSFWKDIECTAWKNPDGEIVVVALNTGEKGFTVRVRMDGEFVTADIPPKSIHTFLWKA